MEKSSLYQLCLDAQEASKKAKRDRQNMARHLTSLMAKVVDAKESLKELEAAEVLANAAEKDAWRNYREGGERHV